MPGMHLSIVKQFEKKDPELAVLEKLYKDHSYKFDEEYKAHIFELGMIELYQESNDKYDSKKG